MSRLLPGPVSIIVATKSEALSSDVVFAGTVGIRIPDSAAALQIIDAFGSPVTATSFNVSGGDAVRSIEHMDPFEDMLWPDGPSGVIIDDAVIAYDVSSTLVRVLDERVELLRAGPVQLDEIVSAAQSMSYFEVSDWT